MDMKHQLRQPLEEYLEMVLHTIDVQSCPKSKGFQILSYSAQLLSLAADTADGESIREPPSYRHFIGVILILYSLGLSKSAFFPPHIPFLLALAHFSAFLYLASSFPNSAPLFAS